MFFYRGMSLTLVRVLCIEAILFIVPCPRKSAMRRNDENDEQGSSGHGRRANLRRNL